MNYYAGFAKNADIRMAGSSGGIFPVIAKKFIDENGIVYASAYDDSFKVEFVRAETHADLRRCFTSKYVQSRTKDVFNRIKTDLADGRNVLFCGTPCQTAGLKRYLEICKCKTDNLLILDFICHGVPSEAVFERYLERFSPKKCISLNMRNKEQGWANGNYSWKITLDDGTEMLQNQKFISYMKVFLSNISLRPSCYACKSKNESSSDITLGDFWGVGGVVKGIDMDKGVSCILPRTEKGMKYLSMVSEELELFEVKYNDILKHNYCLENSVSRPFFRDLFFKEMLNHGEFDKVAEKYSKHTLITRVINKAYSYMPKKGYSVKKLKNKNQRLIYTKKEDCCGCGACVSICPMNAIVLKQDKEGFLYPVIETEKCINCNLCEKVCGFKK